MQVTFEKLFYFAKFPLEVDCSSEFFLMCTIKDEKCLVLIVVLFPLVFIKIYE